MIRGLYSAASGMLVGMARQDVWANNIANAQTPGFRQDDVMLRSFPETLLLRYEAAAPQGVSVGSLGKGADVATVVTATVPGRYVQTDSPLDVAIQGEAFLAVETAAGVRYTRHGRLLVDPEGYLSTAGGDRLIGRDGQPVAVGQGNEPSIAPDGTVSVDGAVVGQLGLWRFANVAALRKQGDNYFAEQPALPSAGETTLRQGTVELPNTDMATAMTEMLSILRAYEASQKALQAQDETLGKAVNEIGRI